MSVSQDPSGPVGEARPPLARVGLVLGPVLFAALLLWPGLPLEGDQRRVAAVTAWTAAWWITAAVPIGAASLLPAALLPLCGVLGGREVAPLYMHDLVFLFLGAFVIALGLQRWGVHRRIAFWIISRVGPRPRNLVLGFMLASAFLSMWISNTSTTLMLLPIAVAVVSSLDGDAEGRSPFALSLLLGVAYAASIGGIGTLVGTPTNQVFAGQFAEAFPDAESIDFTRWLVAWFPLTALFLPLAWVLLTRVAIRVPRDGARGAEAVREARARLGPMSGPERWMAGIFVTTAVLWVTRPGVDFGILRLPGWGSMVAPKGFVTDATVAGAMAILTFLIPVDRARGVYLMDWRTAAKLPWEVLLLLGAGFTIAGAFKSSGLDAVLGEALGPLLAGRSTWIVVLVIVAAVALLTEITSNVATTAVLLPVLGQAAVSAGISPLFTMLPATVAASAAFMLPVATPPNAVVFSSRLVPAPQMARVGAFLNVATVVLVTLVFQLWVRRFLGIDLEVPDWALK
ncbi:MAG: DASS family sodium-coupled anion symporter [Planctomycetota bacterium]